MTERKGSRYETTPASIFSSLDGRRTIQGGGWKGGGVVNNRVDISIMYIRTWHVKGWWVGNTRISWTGCDNRSQISAFRPYDCVLKAGASLRSPASHPYLSRPGSKQAVDPARKVERRSRSGNHHGVLVCKEARIIQTFFPFQKRRGRTT